MDESEVLRRLHKLEADVEAGPPDPYPLGEPVRINLAPCPCADPCEKPDVCRFTCGPEAT